MQEDQSFQPAAAPRPPCRPIIFLDIDGVLNRTKHNTQIHFEPDLLRRLKSVVEAADAVLVLTTFWRHFHEYIAYVFHRNGIDAARHMLPLPMGATEGKQCTKKFLHHHRIKQQRWENGNNLRGAEGVPEDERGTWDDKKDSMIGRSAEDEREYSSRAEEIEAWLKMYGAQQLGAGDDRGDMPGEIDENEKYDFHPSDWKYAILDDRPSAARPGTPLFDRFVFTKTKMGLTERDAERAIKLLKFGP